MKLQMLIVSILLYGCAGQLTEEERMDKITATRSHIRMMIERCEASGHLLVYTGLSQYKDPSIVINAHPSDYLCL